jgi:uncharacterized alpha-E superfamily protein
VLSRTADNLYWMARYIERADYLARIVEATMRLSSLPSSYGGARNAWSSTVLSAGAAAAFQERYEETNERSVSAFLCLDRENPSSIACCIATARANARAVRTALTSQMWEAINGAWLELGNFNRTTMSRDELTRFLDWAKGISLAFDGSMHRTMLRNDAYCFSRLGTAIERADNTARILDVKYHLLLPESEAVGGSLDYFHWTTILREVSAFNAYRWVYRTSVKPWLVADLLILNREMPRSLKSCYDDLVQHLDLLGDAYSARGPSQRIAATTLGKLERTSIEAIFKQGLHEFITEFLESNDRLGTAIVEQYLL